MTSIYIYYQNTTQTYHHQPHAPLQQRHHQQQNNLRQKKPAPEPKYPNIYPYKTTIPLIGNKCWTT